MDQKTYHREIRIDKVRSAASATVMLWESSAKGHQVSRGPNRSMAKSRRTSRVETVHLWTKFGPLESTLNEEQIPQIVEKQ
jgi:hypothetical protein